MTKGWLVLALGALLRCTYACAHLLAHGLLLVPGVNSNNVKAHCLRVLLGQGPKPAASTDDSDSLSGSDS